MWLTLVCIIIGGWDIHSARGGDCGGRYTVQVSVLTVLTVCPSVHSFCSALTVSGSLWLRSGICREGDHLVVGPTDSGQFYKLTIESIQRNRSACRVLRAGQAATLALGDFDRSLLRKVRLKLLHSLYTLPLSNLYVYTVPVFSTLRVWWWWVRRWIPPSAGCLRLRLCCSFMPRPFTKASRLPCTSAMWDKLPLWKLCTARLVHPLSSDCSHVFPLVVTPGIVTLRYVTLRRL